MKNDIPTTGWTCYDFDDLGPGASRKCDACGATTLRYVHHLRHESGRVLAVGKVCAAHLEDDPEAAKRREADGAWTPLPRRMPVPKAGRMVDWFKNWQPSMSNPENIWKRIGADFATVFLKGDSYVGVFRDRFTRKYATQEEAQIMLYHLTVRPESPDDNAPQVVGPADKKTLPF